MDEELKPCPFCGSKEVNLMDDGVFYVSCFNCSTDGPMSDTDRGAIKAWNTRA